MDDAAAIARALDGDLDAYEVLVARYTSAAHRTAVVLGAGNEAEDVVQDAFVDAFRSLRRFRCDQPFRPWLLHIVANRAKNLHRSRNRLGRLIVRHVAMQPADALVAREEPAGEVLAAERRDGVLAAVKELPERERLAIACRYFLDLSEKETAQVLGWPVGSVKSRTFRGLSRLRQRIVAGEEVAQ